MQERTEEQIITQEPIVVVLGSQEIEVRLLTIKESRKWRRKVVKALSMLSSYTGKAVDSTEPEQFKASLEGILSTMPDMVVDLFFAYAVDLDREEMEAKATDAELSVAFGQVMAVGFPLVKSLVQTMGRLSQ